MKISIWIGRSATAFVTENLLGTGLVFLVQCCELLKAIIRCSIDNITHSLISCFLILVLDHIQVVFSLSLSLPLKVNVSVVDLILLCEIWYCFYPKDVHFLSWFEHCIYDKGSWNLGCVHDIDLVQHDGDMRSLCGRQNKVDCGKEKEDHVKCLGKEFSGDVWWLWRIKRDMVSLVNWHQLSWILRGMLCSWNRAAAKKYASWYFGGCYFSTENSFVRNFSLFQSYTIMVWRLNILYCVCTRLTISRQVKGASSTLFIIEAIRGNYMMGTLVVPWCGTTLKLLEGLQFMVYWCTFEI